MPPPFEILRLTLPVTPGERLDKALAAAAPEGRGLSRSRLQALIAEGAVRIPGGLVLRDSRMRIAGGEQVEVRLPSPAPTGAAPEAIPLDVVYEDAHLIVIDKPAGLVVHPAPGASRGTLVNALLHHCGGSLSGVGGALRPGIVHRLDKDTSGLIVVAKSDVAHQGLAAQFAQRSIERRYLAVCWGAPDPADPRLAGRAGVAWEPDGTLRIAAAIGRHSVDRLRMAVVATGGKRAVTRVRVLERFGDPARPRAALVECRLETGRTHQIRVHMAHALHPLVGDTLYARGHGGTDPAIGGFARQALHATTLGFVHPVTGATLRFERPPPVDFTGLLTVLRRNDETGTFINPYGCV
jgi:23S rRNA pseudouridine1911/1915/1917 synthase